MDLNSTSNETAQGRQGNDYSEGPLARNIEKRTAKLPSDVFLWGSVASIGASLVFMLSGKKQVANFIGQWVPTLLLFGVYNKLVKVAGHDSASNRAHS